VPWSLSGILWLVADESVVEKACATPRKLEALVE
jgi:hypothetical protein